MAEIAGTKVVVSGDNQTVQNPAEYRFTSNETSIRRDETTENSILSEEPGTWEQTFAAIDAAGIPDDFLVRDKDVPQKRPDL